MDQKFHTRLESLLRRPEPIALCTVVGSNGSTPQETGAKMAVPADLEIVGTIGGGCVEAEVCRRAAVLLREGRNELLTFSLDHDYGWDDGLICGGTLHVLVDVLRPARDGPLFTDLLNRQNSGKSCVLATIVRRTGSTPADKHLLEPGAALPPALAELVSAERAGPLIDKCLRRGRPVSYRVDRAGEAVVGRGPAAEAEVALEVLFEPVLPRRKLVIAGAGHVGQALAQLASMLEFEVIVIDDRDAFANAQRFPDADRIIVGDIPLALREFPVDAGTYVVVVTRGHKHDCDALFEVVRKPAGYLGLIGSKRKIHLIFESFRSAGVSEAEIARVCAPVGVEIGSRTVAEIAVSIAAQLVQVRSGEFDMEQVRSRHAVPMA